ncbi:restriction endonuclease subunit S [Streptomyces tanashiensis]|uniref:restriction endonuclease subunit S n=1 Tax=Streptomyces tanashiensis TaxID=67367 RepID=UPI00167E7FB3|nr:restriction endonuclease subunit S [Streptomyces tanashiensis]GGY03886.1 hypothetical protein GCM10010299_03520 [Streptomyces tanashiensis]
MSLNLDKTTWKRVRLGDVIRRSRIQADPVNGEVDRYVGGGHIDSDSLTVERSGDVNDGKMGSTFTYLFQPGQVLFVSARPYLRKSGVVNFSGVVADKTYVLDAVHENGLLQEFLPFVLASDHFIAFATAEASGSMNPRLLWGQMQRYEFDLPPLDEQQRLADLLWALERHRAELDGQTSAIEVVLRCFLAQSFRAAPGPQVRIVDLCTDVVGGIWGSPEGEAEIDVLALGPRVYADDATQLATDGSPVRSVSKRQAEVRLVRDGDIILERSGGSPTQPVGRVVIADGELAPCIPTDFQRLLRPNRDVVEPRFLFWRLRHDWAAGVTRDYAKKTTNITNLSVKDYIARSIAVPSIAEQTHLLGRVTSFEDTLTRVAGERSKLDVLCRSLHDEIFGGAE